MDMTLNWPVEERWKVLAQPAHGGAKNPSYLQLLAALDEGWEISQPVYRRPRWLDDKEVFYHFILKHGRNTSLRLITVSDDSTLREFLSERRVAVY
jgi:hypothetical protein